MVTDEEVEDFLEHFGVKGMKWGVRNVSPARQAKRDKKADVYKKSSERVQKSIDTLDSKKPRPTEYGRAAQAARRQELVNKKAKLDKAEAQKRAGKLTASEKKLLAKFGVATALYLAMFLPAPTRSIPPPPGGGYGTHAKRAGKSAADIIRDTQNEQMSSLARMYKEGKMDAEQFANFSKKMDQRYSRKLADVAGGL